MRKNVVLGRVFVVLAVLSILFPYMYDFFGGNYSEMIRFIEKNTKVLSLWTEIGY